MHSKNKGNIGELACATELSKLGYSVFKEFGDLSKIDLIAEKDGKLLRIQCKSAFPKEGTIGLNLRKCGPNYVVKYDLSKLDYFSLYDLENNKLYLIPVTKLKDSQNSFTIRFGDRKNKQHYECNFAEDFEISKVLNNAAIF